MLIREAGPDDVPGIARVHVESWRTTYRGMLSEALLAGLSAEQREPQWWQAIGHGSLFVAVDESAGVVGFASGGLSRLAADEGELYAIYLLQGYQRRGAGRQLFQTVVEWMRGRGLSLMMLWVAAENRPARRFYASLGGREGAGRIIEIAGEPLAEVVYGWHNLATIGQGERG